MHEQAGLPVRVAIIALMVFGSVALWIGDPVLWMWITSRLQSGTQATMGPYVLAIVGIVLTGIVIGKSLSRLNRLYGDVTGTTPTVRIIVPWRRSFRGEAGKDEDAKLPVSLLDVVMVVSVGLAVIALAAWFLIVNPAPPLPGGPGGFKH
jgi:hypothetical protein